MHKKNVQNVPWKQIPKSVIPFMYFDNKHLINIEGIILDICLIALHNLKTW